MSNSKFSYTIDMIEGEIAHLKNFYGNNDDLNGILRELQQAISILENAREM